MNKLSIANIRSWKDPNTRAKRIAGISAAKKKYFSKLSKYMKNKVLKNWMVAGRDAARYSKTRSQSLKEYWKKLSVEDRWKRTQKWSIAGINAVNKKCINTSIEVVLQKHFITNKIEFETQKRIGAMSIDLFVMPNICIFADGVYWHNLPHRKKRDKKISMWLTNNGYEVIRFPERMINEYPDCCVDTVLMTQGRSPTM